VFSAEKVESSVKIFFRRGNSYRHFATLALRQVAKQVDRSLESYMEAQDIRKMGRPSEDQRLSWLYASPPADRENI